MRVPSLSPGPPRRRSAQGKAGKMVQMMRINEKQVTIRECQGQRGVRPALWARPHRSAPTTEPRWWLQTQESAPLLCPGVLQAGAEPASGLDPGTRRSQPGQVPAGRRKELREEADG